MLDITKQMLGQAFVHSLNVFLSDWGSHQGEERENPCSLYVVSKSYAALLRCIGLGSLTTRGHSSTSLSTRRLVSQLPP